MDINATLLVQMIVFALFVLFTMAYVWPPIAKALSERQEKISDGLAAAERGQRELELAQLRASESLKEAKASAQEIIDKANRRAQGIIDEAKSKAQVEAKRQFEIGQEQLAQEVNQAKDALRKQVASLAVQGAEKILGREVDEAANSSLLDNLIKQI